VVRLQIGAVEGEGLIERFKSLFEEAPRLKGDAAIVPNGLGVRIDRKRLAIGVIGLLISAKACEAHAAVMQRFGVVWGFQAGAFIGGKGFVEPPQGAQGPCASEIELCRSGSKGLCGVELLKSAGCVSVFEERQPEELARRPRGLGRLRVKGRAVCKL
jgi:hypothetical protein